MVGASTLCAAEIQTSKLAVAVAPLSLLPTMTVPRIVKYVVNGDSVAIDDASRPFSERERPETSKFLVFLSRRLLTWLTFSSPQ